MNIEKLKIKTAKHKALADAGEELLRELNNRSGYFYWEQLNEKTKIQECLYGPKHGRLINGKCEWCGEDHWTGH